MADVLEEGETFVTLALVAGLGLGLYWLWKNFGQGVTAGAGAATNSVSSAIATLYEDLTFGPPIAASGTLAAQSGAVFGPISSFPAATDSQGNTYLNVNGAIYELGPRNSAGNFTAIPTSGTAAVGSAALPPSASAGGTGSTGAGQTYSTGQT